MALSYFTPLLISSFLTFLLTTFPTQAIVEEEEGFTTDLIHREFSPSSPFYNPSLTHHERVRNSLQRSISRVSERVETNDEAEAQIRKVHGEYLMEVSFGTPPVSQLVIPDTGSDLIWTQCQPCIHCTKQDLPIFDPSKSSTYTLPSCDSKPCNALDPLRRSCTKNNTCHYFYNYGGGYATIGDIATETITFNSKPAAINNQWSSSQRTTSTRSRSFPNLTIGCGQNNVLSTSDPSLTGVFGLGGGPLSFVSQLKSSIRGKFSYCLVPFNKKGNFTSKIKFGIDVSGQGVISTPIVKGIPSTFYYLKLEGISVGNSKIYTNVEAVSSERGIFIDSGSSLNMLPTDMYANLSSALQGTIKGQRVQDPLKQLDLCYKSEKFGSDLNIPNVTFHFSGADLELKYTNTFVPISDDTVCLYTLPKKSQGHTIFGYISQMDYLVGYDTERGTVSFKPTDCSKEQ